VRTRAHDLGMHLVLSGLTSGHRLLHRASGGRLGRRFPGGQQVVWIDTLGRRSGRWRRTPLLAVQDRTTSDGAGGGAGPAPYVVAGSNGGQSTVPSWVLNLRENPAGFIEVDGRAWHASFEEVSGAERDRLYAGLVDSWAAFAGYQRRARRLIPVFRIHLHAAAAGDSQTGGLPRLPG